MIIDEIMCSIRHIFRVMTGCNDEIMTSTIGNSGLIDQQQGLSLMVSLSQACCFSSAADRSNALPQRRVPTKFSCSYSIQRYNRML